MRIRCVVVVALAFAALACFGGSAAALDNGVARTPPMGFNDWNAFGCNVNARLIERSADAMISSGLAAAGYRYVNIDDCWLKHARDAAGNLVPDPHKFPHGIAGVAAYVHARGLKLGIYEDAGAGTCGGFPGSYGHDRQDARTFAGWGVDYLKLDWCNTDDLNPQSEYRRMRDALLATGRPIVFSLSVWGVGQPWRWGPRTANLWRTTSDIKDSWQSVMHITPLNARLWRYARPGAWNDPDMLEVGNGGMTDTEYRTHFSLWAEMAAPLLAGTDVRHMTAATRKILTNRDVIAVDQDHRGVQGHPVLSSGATSVWAKRLAGGDVAVLMLNTGDTPTRVSAPLSRLGLPRARSYLVRDLWTHRDALSGPVLTAGVDRHGVAMFRVAAGGAAAAPAVAVATSTATPYLPAGATTRLTTVVTNSSPRTLSAVAVRPGVPAGWSAIPSFTTADRLTPGGSVTLVWDVQPPAATARGWVTLHPVVNFRVGAHPGTAGAPATVDVPPSPPHGSADLTTLRWAYGSMTPTADLSSRPRLDRSVNKTPLKINGHRYAHGLGVNAWSDVRYYLGGRCSRFIADVGVDDSVPTSTAQVRGTVRVSVLADGRVLFSRFMDWSMPPAHLDLPVAGVNELRLQVDATRDWIWDDATDWGAPRVQCA
jgi:alpha-galactosidase